MRRVVKQSLGKVIFQYRTAIGSDQRMIKRYFESHPVRKLHVSAGQNLIDGWLNSEYYPVDSRLIHIDAARGFPFGAESLDYAFSEHMIEHILYASAENMLSEIYRILKPRGVLRISTPNMSFLVDLLRDQRTEIQENYINWTCNKFTPHAPAPSAIFTINNFFYNFGHTFIYNPATLKHALSRAGFQSIEEVGIMKSKYPELAGLEHTSKMPEGFLELESMIFEAVK